MAKCSFISMEHSFGFSSTINNMVNLYREKICSLLQPQPITVLFPDCFFPFVLGDDKKKEKSSLVMRLHVIHICF